MLRARPTRLGWVRRTARGHMPRLMTSETCQWLLAGHGLQGLLGLIGDHQLVGNVVISAIQIPRLIFAKLELYQLLEILREVAIVIHARIELMDPIDISKVAFGT